ncbi:alanine racemase [Sphingomonas sp.]|jgi:D-serine deaminase-like pyridoxal phosphate-dependent protein|uniref:alanine racemase n=1 Tax=Sphingomonas sp. TaxID=28214 RepID=UPI002DF53E03|nr:alanine racemase [Sphingomonas sp.]
MHLADLPTPALLLDAAKMRANIARMNAAVSQHGVQLRPHLKTAKSTAIAREMTAGWSGAVTVSTLKEAEEFAAAGYRDILYAVGIAPGKLDQAAKLVARGVNLTLILDSVAAAEAVAAHAVRWPVLIEVDSDGRRAGVAPGNAEQLVAIGQALSAGAELHGVMTHRGGSYAAAGPDQLPEHAEAERRAAVTAAGTLRAAGFPCPVVSVGSTPTALFARNLTGVTEVRAGVYVFNDLVTAGLGVCGTEDVAISVATSVIGHQPERGWVLIDAGWMALSGDKGRGDQGYGMVAAEPDLIVVSANQEHGILARRDGGPIDHHRYPIGTQLRILPNHACATAAQHDRYHVLEEDGLVQVWPRFGGW